MKIIFLGLLFCDSSLERAIKTSKDGIFYATHKFQYNLIKGLNSFEDIDMTVLNVPPMGSFPINSKEIYSKTYLWDKNKQIGYLNVPFYKHFVQKNKFYKECKKILANTNEIVHFIVYSPYEPFLKVCNKLKKRYRNTKFSMILTDPIPGIGDLKRLMNKRAINEGKRILKLSECFDSFVVLTTYLYDAVDCHMNRPYEIVECICDESQTKSIESSGKNNIFMYAGALEEEYGILDFVNAFVGLKNAEIWIYGSGTCEKELEILSNENNNIKFFGYASQDVIKEARDQCDFLVNPRRPTGTFTKYSFPSKTAEYMLSGKPVIMYKLEGIPNEYDEFLNYLNSSNSNDIRNELELIINENYESLKEKAEKGRLFMYENKNSIVTE